jgi:hypothetical protein
MAILLQHHFVETEHREGSDGITERRGLDGYESETKCETWRTGHIRRLALKSAKSFARSFTHMGVVIELFYLQDAHVNMGI